MAKAAVNEPWAERIEGARRAARDARAAVQGSLARTWPTRRRAPDRRSDSVGANQRCRGGDPPAHTEWARIAQEISELASLVAPMRPGDVSFTRCEALAREASRVLQEGGEQARVLRRAAPQAVIEEPVAAA